MNFFYDPRCGNAEIEITGENYTHLIKARRAKVGDTLFGRNFQDGCLYSYNLEDIARKKANLTLMHKEKKEVEPYKNIHLAWSIVESKTVEKTLPFLNELGVKRLSLFFSDRSQKNISLCVERLEKILINSSCQCGRSSYIDLEMVGSLEKFLDKYPQSSYLHFGGEKPKKEDFFHPILVGPEGGFSKKDLGILKTKKRVGLDHPLILRSETATISLASLGALA